MGVHRPQPARPIPTTQTTSRAPVTKKVTDCTQPASGASESELTG